MRHKGSKYVITCTLLLVLSACSSQGAWDLFRILTEDPWLHPTFSRRIPISIDNSLSTESFTNFPVLVILDGTRIDYSAASSDGSDIAFYDESGIDLLAHEIDTWIPGGSSFIWVRIPYIEASGTETRFWLYYSPETGSASAGDPADTWSDGFLGVWHLDDPGGFVGAQYDDSSSFARHGVGGASSQTSPSATPGIIGNGQGYDGLSNSVSLSDNVFDNLGPATFELWAYMDVLGGALFSKFGLRVYTGGSNRLYVERDFSVATLFKEFNNVLSVAAWRYVAITWDGTTAAPELRVYRDGQERSDTTRIDGIGTLTDDSGTDLFIGNSSVPASVFAFNGTLDEVRISNVVRSADWINAQFLSMTDSFLTFGSEQEI